MLVKIVKGNHRIEGVVVTNSTSSNTMMFDHLAMNRCEYRTEDITFRVLRHICQGFGNDWRGIAALYVGRVLLRPVDRGFL